MNKIQIKNRFTDEVIFEYKCKNNTIKKTVEEAVKRSINLSYANLKRVKFICVQLKNISFRYANLHSFNFNNDEVRYYY